MVELVFTPTARRFLVLALLQAEDGRTINPMPGDDEALDLVTLLHHLGLLEPVAGGWTATEFLLAQPWAEGLKAAPFRCLNAGGPCMLCVACHSD